MSAPARWRVWVRAVRDWLLRDGGGPVMYLDDILRYRSQHRKDVT